MGEISYISYRVYMKHTSIETIYQQYSDSLCVLDTVQV